MPMIIISNLGHMWSLSFIWESRSLQPHVWQLSLKASVDILQQYQGYVHIVAVS